MSFSAWFIPLLITGLFSWGLCSGVDVFDCFLQGAKEGLKTAASITPASTAAALKALEIMQAEPERQDALWDLTHYALDGFRALGIEIGNTSTPIIPLFVRDNFKTFAITRDLLDEGIFVNHVVSPAVAPHDTLIRFSLMATHTREQVTTALEKIGKVFRKHGIIAPLTAVCQNSSFDIPSVFWPALLHFPQFSCKFVIPHIYH